MANSDKINLPKDSGKEIGSGAAVIPGSLINGGDYNRELSGRAGNKWWEIMRRSDATVHAALQIVKLPLLATTVSINAATNKEGKVEDNDELIAEYIKSQLITGDIKPKRMLRDILSYCDFGFSVLEKIYKICEFEGKQYIGIQKLGVRKQPTIYKWTTDDGAPGVTQLVGGKFISIPIEKLAIFTFDKEGDTHQGIPLLRYIYKAWDLKDKLELVNAMALEKLGVGVAVVKEREGSTMTTKDELQAIDAVSNIRANNRSYLKVPKTAEIEMLDLKGNSAKDVLPTLNYLDSRIMAGVLGRFMELGGASGSGAQSLGSDMSSFFMKAEYAMAEEIAEYINEQVIRPLCDLNFSDMPNGYPEFSFGTLSDADPTALSSSLKNLADAGIITPDADLEEHMRDELHLPKMSDDVKETWERKIEQAKNAPGANDDAGDDTLSDDQKKKITEKAQEELKKTKDVNATVKAARDYRDTLIGMTAGY